MEIETQTQVKQTTWTIDPTHSVIGFSDKHMLISTVHGRFTRFDAAVVFYPDSPETAQLEAKIDTTSVETGEPKRDEHLRSADFFDSENYPHIIFRSKDLRRTSDERWKLTGDLSIRGTTHEIILDMEGFSEVVKDPWGNARMGGTATATLNRFDYGLHFSGALETGGLVVGEKVKIQLDIELMRPAD